MHVPPEIRDPQRALLRRIHPWLGGLLVAAPIAWCPTAQASKPPASATPVIEAQVLAAFDRAPTQRVLIELREPIDSSRMPPEPELPRPRSAPARQQGSSALLRVRALDEQKSALLGALRAVPGMQPRVVHSFRPFRLLALDVTAGHVARLRTMHDIARVWADQQLTPQLDSSLPYVQASEFHQSKASGAGTTVAVLDTPVRIAQPAFGSCPAPGAPGCSVRLQLNFASSSIDEVIAQEDLLGIGSHGTNVAAIVLGVAPQTQVLSLNVFHRDPYTGSVVANLSDTLAAMAWVAENAEDYGIVAINSSLGTFRSDSTACNDAASFDPIRTLHRDHGVLTVTVSGNDGLPNAVRDPGCVSSAVTVGAVFDHDASWYGDPICSQSQPHAGQLACFSNLNGLVDLVAPGVDVSAGGYSMTGTSQAAPHVAGAIAAWQSWYLAQEGAFRSAAWMQRNLLAGSSSPLIHVDSRSFSQLRMLQGVDWAYAHAFGWWYQELPDNVIAASAPGLREQLTISGQPWNVAGAYLYLELVHPQPERVQVTLTSPSGKTASSYLPYGQANFTGILGRTVFPGALASLAGSPANGTWTVTLRDTQGNDVGHYLQAVLYLTREGCQPRCEAEACGDDRCGGQCGSVCIIDGSCHLEGDRSDDNPCQGCRPASSPAAWTTLDGESCDDGDACTILGECKQGTCESQPTTCEPPGPCQLAVACDSVTGTCQYEAVVDGTWCDDGEACTTGDACHAGQCKGSPVAGCGDGDWPADEMPAADSGVGTNAADTGDGGCGCRAVGGGARSSAPWWVATLAGALVALRRRRGAALPWTHHQPKG